MEFSKDIMEEEERKINAANVTVEELLKELGKQEGKEEK
jgi:hypothetical protein